jgi:hypothetical protein
MDARGAMTRRRTGASDPQYTELVYIYYAFYTEVPDVGDGTDNVYFQQDGHMTIHKKNAPIFQ